MKPAAAFATGLWTGALVMAAVGVVYLRILDRGRADIAPQSQEQLETRVQLLQQEQAKAAAEAQRLRQTVAELRTAPVISPEPVRASRPARYRDGGGADSWIVDSVLTADSDAVANLEQAAQQNNLYALDGLALLAEHDSGAALTRVWSSSALTASTKGRATMLLAATVETNPHGAELIEGLTGNAALVEAAVVGLGAPDFSTRLVRGTAITPPPHFKPDYALRLRIVENLRQAVTDEALASVIDRIQSNLTQRASTP
ncbi:MAG: hypothetical protein WCS70_03570 [Verrucomicrobiota bacterium]